MRGWVTVTITGASSFCGSLLMPKMDGQSLRGSREKIARSSPSSSSSESSKPHGTRAWVNLGAFILILSCYLLLIVTGRDGYWCGELRKALRRPGSGVRSHHLEHYESNGRSVPLNVSTPLECFQVHPPVWTSSGWSTKTASDGVTRGADAHAGSGPASCSVLLMEHSFGFSYGHPFVGHYTPPPCTFNRVTMNLTVTSRGRQFDRLAMMYLNDTEVFRTSTAEPTANGIIWTYTKDMTAYLSLWTAPQKIIFDLGNLVDDTYTGLFNTTLTATFFSASSLDPADLILPISAARSISNSSSNFVLPDTRAVTTLSLPRNAHRAVVAISSTGQATEEFWWGNVPSPYISTFTSTVGDLYGFSPFRCTHLYIDGLLAGLAAPFPIIFTGGVVPALWRPIVGPDAFDLRDSYIDVTPFLGVLSDGREHVFEIKIAGLDGRGIVESVGQNWVVSGKLLLWLDEDASAITTGPPPVIDATEPRIAQQQQLVQDGKGENETLSYSTGVSRIFTVTSSIKSQAGEQAVQWTQSIRFFLSSQFTDYGLRQVVDLHSDGTDSSTGATPFTTRHNYDYVVDTSMEFDPSDAQSNLTIDASIELSASHWLAGSTAPGAYAGAEPYTGSSVVTQLTGQGHYFSSPRTKTGLSFGSTRQSLSSVGVKVGGREDLYGRLVEAVNGTVVSDREVLEGVTREFGGRAGTVELGNEEGFVHLSAREMLGRGPG